MKSKSIKKYRSRHQRLSGAIAKHIHMKNFPSLVAVFTCLLILSGCADSEYSDPDQVAEAYVRAVITKDESHTDLELTGLNPELRSYCNAGLTTDWRASMPSQVTLVERLESTVKGPGRAENLNDYMVGLTGDGPFTSSGFITYVVELKFVDGDGKEHTAALALRPSGSDQPLEKSRIFDWKDVEWKVVPR